MADGVRRIVRALHTRAGEDEEKEAKEFFEKLDSNGDGKISLEEFKKGIEHRLSSERVFRQLDSKGDGGLSFDDALVLFYCSKKAITILQCCGCDELIFGPSFCCFECLFESHDRRFTLCCDCYGKGKLQHPHPLSPIDLLHDKTLLDRCSQRPAEDEAKKETEKLSNIAKSHYRAASLEVKAMANEFFKSMDTDGDGGVDLEEFLTFVRENGYTHMHNNHFFKMLDMKGKGSLDFWETMTLYYIIKSGRPFCNCCAEFIPGIYFSCVVCFENPKTSYNICYTCYHSERCKHSHKGSSRALFLDNYTLLQATREPATGENYEPQNISDASKPPEGARVAGASVEQQPKRSSALKTRKASVEQQPKRSSALKTQNDSDRATEYMMNKLNEVLSESQSTAIVARNISTPSTYQTQHVNPHSHKHNGESSSQSIRRRQGESSSQEITTVKMAVATFKVLEAALTIASLSATCTIL